MIATLLACWAAASDAVGQSNLGPTHAAPVFHPTAGGLPPAADSSVGYGQFLSDDFPKPLPPITETQPPTRLAAFPSMMTEPLLGDPDNPVLLPPVDQPKKPPGRPGFFQRGTFTTTYLPRLNGDGVGFLGLDVNAVFGLPAPTRESPLLIRPGFEVNFVEASTAYDLPSELYDNYLEFRWLSKLTPRFGVDISVTPGWHSDYQNSSGEDDYRTVAYGVGAYDWSPTVTVAAGIIYLDRDDVRIAPAGGVIWTPNDDVRMELIAPRPRVARRFASGPFFNDWVYVAGEFGGGQWGIERAGGIDDVLTAADWRAILGVERKSTDLGFNGRLEIGYVFGRVLEYQSGLPNQDLPDTMMARLGIWY